MRILESEIENGQWRPRDNGVIVKAIPISPSGIILPQVTAKDNSVTFVVVAVDDAITDLKKGDIVDIAAASLIELYVQVEEGVGKFNPSKNNYYWVKNNFIKLAYTPLNKEN